MSDSVGERLASVRKHFGVSQRAFADRLGVSAGLIGSLETGARPPSRSFLEVLTASYGVSPDWVLSGFGEMIRSPGGAFKPRSRLIEPPDKTAPDHGDVRVDGHEFVFIPRRQLEVSAGPGVIATEADVDGGLGVPSRWLAQAGLNGALCVIVEVKGDSMAPTIADGASILLDLTEKRLIRPAIYAFGLDGEAFVKRLVPSEIDPNGQPGAVGIFADNPAYPPLVLVGPRLLGLRIVGRVRAVFAAL